MKILCISDKESAALWDRWNEDTRKRLEDVRLILSAGDLDPAFLEFLVTMMSVPLVYVRGNHDDRYSDRPPEGCICAEDELIELSTDRFIRIAGLGGSMKYRDGLNMYTEKEMARRVRGIERKIRLSDLRMRAGRRLAGSCGSSAGGCETGKERMPVDILLTHAPCLGYGDQSDLPHRGFACVEKLIGKWKPAVHCYGHVHREYGDFAREMTHPAGTRLVNAWEYCIIEV